MNRTDSTGRSKSNVVAVRALFVDFDGADPTNIDRLSFKASCGAETSPGRYHFYWTVKGVSLDEFPLLQRRLAILMGGDGSVCDLPRVMRLPGFVHQKREPFMVRILSANDPFVYDRNEFVAALEDAERLCRVAPSSNIVPITPSGSTVAPSSAQRVSKFQPLDAAVEANLPPADPAKIRDGCAHIRYFAETSCAKEGEEPLWKAALGVLAFCDNGIMVAHNWSKKDPRYDAKETQSKLDDRRKNQTGASLCSQFAGISLGCKATCEACPHFGKIKSPISLGYKAAPASTDDASRAELERLAALPLLEYGRARIKAAEKLGITVGILDKVVAGLRPAEDIDNPGQGHMVDLIELEPWPHRVDGAELLEEIFGVITKYVVLPEAEAAATALWIVASHACMVVRVFPRLLLKSPEPECGKSTLFDVIAPLVNKVVKAEHSTVAAMFRIIELKRPTLIFDEGDTFLKENEDMRGIINSGHRRDGSVMRVVGEDLEPRAFSTYCPLAIASIGKLPATIEGRSIIIKLKRRLPTEQVSRFRDEEGDRLRGGLGRKVSRFAADHLETLSRVDPAIPGELGNRKADNWRPLVAIADLAGGRWPALARSAALELSGKGDSDERSHSVMLLSDIRDMFERLAKNPRLFVKQPIQKDQEETDRARGEDVAAYLNALADQPWGGWNRGRGITPSGISKVLKEYGIAPRQIRIGDKRPNGYLAEWFDDAFMRYLPNRGSDNSDKNEKSS